jgi:hypothetical protein
MSAPTLVQPTEQALQTPRWSLSTRVSFRFCFVYLGLFCLTTQIATSLFSPSQGEVIPDPATIWPMRQLILWTAAHVFHRTATLAGGGNSASGDFLFGWVLALSLLILAAVSTVIWSLADKKRENYANLHKWFELFIRFCLAGQLLNYGFAKAIPNQMPFPSLLRLTEPFGNFSPMGVLWSSIGAAPAYEIFTGCVEVLAGLLLFIPRTTALGAWISLAAMIEVFILNMTYDVPVKLFSFHLILLSLFLVAPEFKPMFDFFLLKRRVSPSAEVPLFAAHRANRVALAGQLLFGVWLIGMNARSGWDEWYEYGGARPVSPLYGVWEVSQELIDEQVRPPLLTDSTRPRRIIFDFPSRMAFQAMDDTFVFYGSSININDKTLLLTSKAGKKARFSFNRSRQNQLTLDGAMESHKIHMELRLVDTSKLLLVSRGFHWIQESAFNR